jgi:hypothetical protein
MSPVSFITVGLPTTPVGPPLAGRIRTDGRMWRNDAGYYRPCYMSAFMLPALFCREPDRAKSMLDLAVTFGFNGVRVLVGALTWGPQSPEEGRAGLPPLCEAARERNLTVEVTCLSDSETGYNIDSHLQAVGDICRQYDNTLTEVANEPYHSTQAEEVHDFANLSKWGSQYLGGTSWASGAWETDEPDPNTDVIDGPWLSIHLDRSRDEWNMVRRIRELEADSNNYERPVNNNEPIGWAEYTEEGRRNSNPAIAFTMGALCRGFEVGSVSHGDQGPGCGQPGPIESECHRQVVQGFRVMPSDARLTYKNAGWADSPILSADFENTIIRAYSFLDTGDHGWTVALGITGDPGIVWQNGFHPLGVIAERTSPSGNVQVMEIAR